MFKKISKDWILITSLALFKLAIHFFTNTNYELHRDAFLYLAESDHLAFGYWSEAPMIAVLGRLTQILFGSSTFAIRLLPALVGTISVVLIGALVRRLGGKFWAILLACTAFILSPAFLRGNTLFQPVSFNQFFWLLITFFVVKLLQSQNPKYWIHLGVISGFAFLTKYSVLFLVVALLISILLTQNRRLLFSRYFMYGLGIGLLIFLPNIIWQYNHNFPVILHMTRLHAQQLVHVRVGDFFYSQLLMNFPNAIVWIAGLVFLLFTKSGKPYRELGFTFLGVIFLLLVLKGKGYYTLGIYPILFVFGGLAFEKWFSTRFRFFRPVIFTLMILLLLPLLPYSLPIYPLEKMIEFGEQSRKFGGEGALRWEDGKIHALPQDYADMIGWREVADVVIRTYSALSDSEKANCIIFGDNYGEAGAIKFYGKPHGLPEPVCFDGSFLFWAPDSAKLTTLICANAERRDMEQYFTTVEKAGEITSPYARESGMPVYLCRNPKNGFEAFYAEKVSRMKRELSRENGM